MAVKKTAAFPAVATAKTKAKETSSAAVAESDGNSDFRLAYPREGRYMDAHTMIGRSPLLKRHFRQVYINVLLAQLVFFIPLALHFILDTSREFRISSLLLSSLVLLGLLKKIMPPMLPCVTRWDTEKIPTGLLLTLFLLMGIGFGGGICNEMSNHPGDLVSPLMATLLDMTVYLGCCISATLVPKHSHILYMCTWFPCLGIVCFVPTNILVTDPATAFCWFRFVVAVEFFHFSNLVDEAYIMRARIQDGKVDAVFDAFVLSTEYFVIQAFNVLNIRILVAVYCGIMFCHKLSMTVFRRPLWKRHQERA